MTSRAESSPREGDALAKRLWVVRGATIGTLLLSFVPVPPWEWSDSVAPLLIALFSIPLLATLWRLRKPPYKDGLALAMAVGGALLLFAGLAIFTTGSFFTPNWQTVGFLALGMLAQGVLVGGAVATYRALGYSKGDWTVFSVPHALEPPPERRTVFSRRLWIVRGAAMGTVLLACVPSPPWEWMAEPAPLMLVVPIAIPFLMILWRLRRTPRKNGLALAIGTGAVLIVISGLFLFVAASDGGTGWGAAAFLALFMTTQVVLAGGGVATYKLVGYSKGDWKLLARGVVEPLVYFGVMGVVLAGSLPMHFQSRARRASVETMGWIARLHGCASAYAASHPAQGFPARLDLLGPNGTRCIEPLSPKNERSGYVFQYTPSAPEASGKISDFALTARPVDRGRYGQKSFYLDATGTIRSTTEDRPATPEEPAAP